MVVGEISDSRTVFKIADRRKSRDASSACEPVLEPVVGVEAILAGDAWVEVMLRTNMSPQLVSNSRSSLNAAPLQTGI